MIARMTAARSRWLQQAREIWRDPAFRLGVADSRPVAFGVAAWGLVAGAAMVKSGLAMPLAALMSLMMFAGAAQLSALPLISGGAPMWVIWATALCINLRFMVFSVQYRPYFAHLPRRRRILLSYFSGDTMFALFTRRYPDPVAAPEQVRYFAGGAAVNWGSWQASVMTGIVLGDRIPQQWGIGFAGTMALLALTCSQLRDRSTWLAAAVAGCAAVAAYALPLRMNILVAIAAAVAVGILSDQMNRRSRT